MSREIKFRVWSEEDKEYRKDCRLLSLFDCVTGCPAIIYNDEGDRFDIEQYTGLKDKNGKEIYEGDIITETYSASKDGLYKENGEYKVEDYWVVKYNVKRAGFSPFCDCSTEGEYLYEEYIPKRYVEVEVLGNIHENPELLEN